MFCLYVLGNAIFAGTGSGEIFGSYDYGISWVSISDGLIGAPVLVLYYSGTYLYAGLNAGGVWKRPLSEITEVTKIKGNSLIRLYPNPARNKLISETDHDNDICTISVIDVNGQELIKHTVIGCKTEIDISNLAKGVYFIKKYNSSECIFVSKFVKE